MITATGTRVPGVGPVPCDIMIVGEAPGYDEANWYVNGVHTPTPFVGPSGVEQDKFLQLNGLHRRRIYITNLIKRYIEGNANPTLEDIRVNEPELIDEIRRVQPRFILSVGAFATRWFLSDVDMEAVHGLPHSVRNELLSVFPRSSSITVIPCYHPAFGLRDPDAKVLVFFDYQQAAKIIKGAIPSTPVRDEFPNPLYLEATADNLDFESMTDDPDGRRIREFAIDVEGPLEPELRGNFWGFSVCFTPGVGLVARRANKHFNACVNWLNWYIAKFDPLIVYHNAMGIDIETLRLAGLRGHDRRLYDTMVAAYMLRVEPQGLKVLARRHCGMEMRTYEEVIGDAMREQQLSFLINCASRTWGVPEPRLVDENDGTSRIYKPQPLHVRASKILEDYYSGQPTDTDLYARWRKVDRELQTQAQEVLGPWPQATLDDVPLASAIAYSGRDPDATLRLKRKLVPMVAAMGLEDRCQLDLDILPILEEMQSTGIPADRKYFEWLSSKMWDDMMRIGSRISHKYNNGQPFNPASAPQVSALVASRGLKGVKKTKTGKVSTSKKSMEHLRVLDDAMDDIFAWREHQKVRDSYAEPILDRIPVGVDSYPIRCNIRSTRVTSGRISASDPNLTGMPVSTELGLMVRDGFVAPVDYLFGSGDSSQIEMRVMAHLSADPFMCKLFHERRDIHSETAILIYGLPNVKEWDDAKQEFIYPSVKKLEHRNPTKRAGFGVITGIMGGGLLDQLRQQGCTGWVLTDDRKDVKNEALEVRALIREWFKVYPGVKNFIYKTRARAAREGMVREMFGFPRYLPGIWSDDFYVRAESERQSHSHIISGSAQSMLRRAMRYLKPQIDGLRQELGDGNAIRWLIQIHDEIVYLYREELDGIMKVLVLDALRNHQAKLRVPVEANWGSAKTWGKLK